jgi:hypothetical protein
VRRVAQHRSDAPRCFNMTMVIPRYAIARRGIHTHDGGYGFRAHRGRKTIAWGMRMFSGASAVNTRARLNYPQRARGCGCIGRPAFPAPSSIKRVVIITTRAHSALRDSEGVLQWRDLMSRISSMTHPPRCNCCRLTASPHRFGPGGRDNPRRALLGKTPEQPHRGRVAIMRSATTLFMASRSLIRRCK